MKKIVASLIISVLIGTVFMSYASIKENPWNLVENERYSMLQIDSENPILIKHLQDRDYQQIEDLLVDESVSVMAIQAMKEALSDPDAVMVDNILPDGRHLKENWFEIKNNLIVSKHNIRALKDIKSKGVPQDFNGIIETSQGKINVKLQNIMTDQSAITIPKTPNDFPAEFIVTADGRRSFIASDTGIWLINNNRLQKVSLDKYNNKSYEELSKISLELYNENIVTWNNGLMPDKAGTKLAYVSNKHNIKNGRNALFVYDIDTNKESLILESDNANYMVEGWLDDNNIICRKLRSDGMTYVIVSLKGHENKLELIGDYPFIYATRNNNISYAESLGSEKIHIVSYTGDSLQPVESLDIGGQTIIRAGMNGFSPDNSKFATLYVPKGNQNTRYIKIKHLNSDKVINIDSLPNKSDYILEFSWIDNNTMLIVTGRQVNGITEESTWTYFVDGGNL